MDGIGPDGQDGVERTEKGGPRHRSWLSIISLVVYFFVHPDLDCLLPQRLQRLLSGSLCC